MKFWIYLRHGGVVALKVTPQALEGTLNYLNAAVEGTSLHQVLRWGDSPENTTVVLASEIVAFASAGESEQNRLLEEHNALLRKAVKSMDTGEEWREQD